MIRLYPPAFPPLHWILVHSEAFLVVLSPTGGTEACLDLIPLAHATLHGIGGLLQRKSSHPCDAALCNMNADGFASTHFHVYIYSVTTLDIYNAG